jgi:hypothetical protein
LSNFSFRVSRGGNGWVQPSTAEVSNYGLRLKQRVPYYLVHGIHHALPGLNRTAHTFGVFVVVPQMSRDILVSQPQAHTSPSVN